MPAPADSAPAAPLPAPRPSRRVVAAITLGTVLNPLNSSMIAVALIRIQDDFDVSVVSGAWLISSFYLVAAVGQSVLGRLADQFGPRRILLLGFALVALGGLLAPLAPDFGWLIAARMVLAVGTSAGFPAGLALLRDASDGRTPGPSTLAVITIANSSMAAVGPVVGGALVALAGWAAIFYVNVGLAAVALPLVLRWLPRDRQHRGGVSARLAARTVDVPGIVCFSAMLAAVLGLLLSLAGEPLWWLAPVALAAAAGLVVTSRRRADPFLDVRMLRANRRLLGVCAQYLLVNVIAFGVFFAVPMWLESVPAHGPGATGLLVAPLALVSVAAAPAAARLVARAGVLPALVLGVASMVAGSLLLLTFGDAPPVALVVTASAVLGLPIAFNNIGLQTALYAATDAEGTGAAAGLFQSCRFVGAVLSTTLLGIVFADGVTTDGLHTLALIFAALAAVVLAANLVAWRGRSVAPSESVC